MNKSQITAKLSNTILWAAAIIASALIGNSSLLTVLILPSLALMSISKSVYFNKKDDKTNQQTDDDVS